LFAASFAAPSGARALSADGFEYTVAGSAATVTGCTSTCPANLVIPGTLGGYSVTTIGEFAFDRSALTSVTIPNSVTGIGEFAFEGNALTTVTIPDSVTYINGGAFDTNALTTVTIGNSVTTIGGYVFLRNALTTVAIPASVTEIGPGAFESNTLTSVSFLGNAPTEGAGVFADNIGLTFVTRFSGTTGWGATWNGVPVVTEELPPTNRDAAPWLMALLLLLLASVTVAAGIQLRQRESRRN
jgi:hypothetical protein